MSIGSDEQPTQYRDRGSNGHLLRGVSIQLFRLLEVDDVPDGFKIVWFHVLVLEVERL
jgi:hypothetical protein